MPKLTQKEFAALAQSMPGASEDEILAAAREKERQSYEQPGIWDRLNTPLYDVPEFEHNPEDSVFTRWAKKAGNLGSALAEGMTSPIGLASMAMPIAGAGARAAGLYRASRAAAAGEAAIAAPFVASGAVNTAHGLAEGDPVQAGVGALEAGLGALGVRGAVGAHRAARQQSDQVLDMLRNNEPGYGVVTGANPRGEAMDPSTNRALQEMLERELRAEGLNPMPQRGVYGQEEPSFLVPGLTADRARRVAKDYDQQAVITDAGWHRKADDATFPRTGIEFDQAADDFYSEIVLPDGRKVKYQAKFPDEAFEQPAVPDAPSAAGSGSANQGASPTVDPRPGQVDASTASRTIPQEQVAAARAGETGTKGSSPSIQGSTVMAVAAPAAAPFVDTGNEDMDTAIRAALLGGSAGVFGAAVAKQLKHVLPESVGSLAKAIQKTDTPGQYRLKPEVIERLNALHEIGRKLPKQSSWQGATSPELIAAFDGDIAKAKTWANLWGATSPNTSVPVNTRESLSAQVFAMENPGQLMTDDIARAMDPVITQAPSKVPNINAVLKGETIKSPKVNRMGRFMMGEEGAFPLDTHALWALGVPKMSKAKFADEMPELRALFAEAEGVPARGSFTDEALYSRVEDALRRAFDEIAPGAALNPSFATMWEGTRAAKGLAQQGGPLDVLREKGLLQIGAMLDLKTLRKVLKSAGWTAGAIGLVLKGMSREPKPGQEAA